MPLFYQTVFCQDCRIGHNDWFTSNLPFINFPLLSRASEIRNAVMVVHGEKAHSRYYIVEATVALMRGSLATAFMAKPPKPQIPSMPMRSASTSD